MSVKEFVTRTTLNPKQRWRQLAPRRTLLSDSGKLLLPLLLASASQFCYCFCFCLSAGGCGGASFANPGLGKYASSSRRRRRPLGLCVCTCVQSQDKSACPGSRYILWVCTRNSPGDLLGERHQQAGAQQSRRGRTLGQPERLLWAAKQRSLASQSLGLRGRRPAGQRASKIGRLNSTELGRRSGRLTSTSPAECPSVGPDGWPPTSEAKMLITMSERAPSSEPAPLA